MNSADTFAALQDAMPDGLTALTQSEAQDTTIAVTQATADQYGLEAIADLAIAANSFVALTDPKNNWTAQNVLPRISTAKASPTVTAALASGSEILDIATLTEPNGRVAAGSSAQQVADEWLSSHDLG